MLRKIDFAERGDVALVLVAIDKPYPTRGRAEIEAIEQRLLRRVGDDQLAIGMANIASQFVAAPRGVDAHQRGAGKRGASGEKQILGNVLKQHADVKGAGLARLEQHLAAHRAGLHNLAPCPRRLLEDVALMIVVGAFA